MAFDLDRAIDALARHEIYSIVDLHALPDWQNQHWHSDNPTRCRVWDHRHFQDRVDDQDQADRAAVEDPFNPTRICSSAVVRSRYHYAEPVFSSQSLDRRNSFGGLRTFDLEAQHLDQPSVVRTGIGRLYWWSCKITVEMDTSARAASLAKVARAAGSPSNPLGRTHTQFSWPLARPSLIGETDPDQRRWPREN